MVQVSDAHTLDQWQLTMDHWRQWHGPMTGRAALAQGETGTGRAARGACGTWGETGATFGM